MSINPKFRNMLINRIGKKVYYNTSNETKQILIFEEIKKLNQEIENEYGSMRNFRLEYVRDLGFKNCNEYNLYCVKLQGFDSIYEYQTWRAKEKGYTSRWKRYVAENNINPIDVAEKRAKKRGFKNYKEYENWLAEQKGFKDRNEYRRFLHKKKNPTTQWRNKK